jgi:hypothetical protein
MRFCHQPDYHPDVVATAQHADSPGTAARPSVQVIASLDLRQRLRAGAIH